MLGRAMQGRAAAEAVLSGPRLMMEVRRVIPHKVGGPGVDTCAQGPGTGSVTTWEH